MQPTVPNDTLEEWLEAMLPPTGRNCLLDVGAYHGDFSRFCLDRGLARTVHLFEPNPANQTVLAALCASHPGVTLHKLALGDTSGESDFHCSADTATGSLLPYAAQPGAGIGTFRVTQQTLDRWWAIQGKPKVGLLKVDTQGHDLSVLENGREMLASERPWIVTELIFIACYERQAKAAELFAWAESSRYALAGLFNEHWTRNGLMAFADAAFIPVEALPPAEHSFNARPTLAPLQAQVAQLRQVCDERLKLIEYLHAEAEKRLRVIEELNRALQQNKPV